MNESTCEDSTGRTHPLSMLSTSPTRAAHGTARIEMTVHEAITTNRWRTIARAKSSITVAFDWDNLIQACRTITSDHSVPGLRGPIPDLEFYGRRGIIDEKIMVCCHGASTGPQISNPALLWIYPQSFACYLTVGSWKGQSFHTSWKEKSVTELYL